MEGFGKTEQWANHVQSKCHRSGDESNFVLTAKLRKYQDVLMQALLNEPKHLLVGLARQAFVHCTLT